MPGLNTTVDDTSPLISYQPVESWHYGSAQLDDYATQYTYGTFTLTTTLNATATFKFNGTGVWIYGAKRPNHGTYSVTLDQQQKWVSLSGTTSDGLKPLDARGNELQALLWGTSNLTSGSHEVVVTNEEDERFLDIDFITWESTVGSTTSQMSPTTLGPNDFQTSGSGWGVASTNSALGASTGIYTTVAGDSTEIIFEVRDAVEVYGSVGVLCGIFDVEIDGGVPSSYNASRHQNFTNQLLFYGSDLGSGQHSLKMTNDVANNATLVIDHAQAIVADTSVSPVPTSSADAVTSSNQDASDGGTNKALVGGLCGALAFLVLLIVLAVLYLWITRRKRFAISSRKTAASKVEAFDIDRPSAPSSQGSIRSTTLSGLFRGITAEIVNDEARSDVSESSRKARSSSDSRVHSHKTSDLVASHQQANRPSRPDNGSRGKHAHSPRRAYDEQPKIASNVHLPYDNLVGNASSSRLPDGTGGRPSSRSHNRSYQHLPHEVPVQKSIRPLPTVPRSKSNNDLNVNIVRVPPVPSASQPYRSTTMMKGRRRSISNSRVLRAGYNFLFAKPGSSNSGSAYAPSTVLTSEISERPTTTLSPVTEAPPPLPPIRSVSPQPPRPLQIANQVDDT